MSYREHTENITWGEGVVEVEAFEKGGMFPNINYHKTKMAEIRPYNTYIVCIYRG